MSKVVISDTSCFIILSKINELELLHKVYENILTKITIRPPVFSARRANGGNATAKFRVNQWLLNLKFIGTIGLIIKAKLDGVIPSVKPLLQKIKLTNFRLSTDLEQYALKEAKEL